MEILAGDLSDFKLGAKAAEAAKSRFGQLDGLIVNHGILAPVKRVADVEAEEWRHLFDVNVFGAVAMVGDLPFSIAISMLRSLRYYTIMLSTVQSHCVERRADKSKDQSLSTSVA